MARRNKPGFLAGALLALSLPITVNAQQSTDPIRIAYIEPLSGAFANVGDAGLKHFRFAADMINQQGGVMGRKFEIVPMDNKQSASESTQLLQRAIDDDIPFVTQGNGSNVAGALVQAVDRNNRRNEDNRILFLNYAAVDPALTNDQCSFYHFRFDASSDIKLEALTNYMAEQEGIKKVFLINQDYSHGHVISELAKKMLNEKRPDIEIAGDVLHPIGQVRDFSPYVARIKQSGADSVITGNWGNDLSLLVRAADNAGLDVDFYTYYGGGLGTPAAVGERGEDSLHQITTWHADVNVDENLTDYEKWFTDFKQRYPEIDWYYHQIYNQMFMLKAAIEEAGTTDAVPVAKALEGMTFDSPTGTVTLREKDHQMIQPMYISVMDSDAKYDADNSGLGFRTVAKIPAEEATVPTTCEMQRP
ncbi:branched-chain amino acid ABC transporter substrate-binding protein [Marinobacter nanhaiticus D15-8W]|uniref:Branched-chain amino acid ABC transporter substrate-binding protein n=1 Tax=Marinobacter nanhaiticus D15-8W TaxID=626887 RepID=N6VXE8_9GAMM|nr:branched-chain amino acid ABC transporter substrate-binding protein [Marinobacter nanhaiticus]ENO14935.1 branched-chain amino acid ABC transporter substrate-binding protein [Marinobacter nanhaiticus D15-8W]BES69369.1 branched-chain amino acid ABC transporter substrate-binding protein [Marinobacter nanhaiticus D15-8W]